MVTLHLNFNMQLPPVCPFQELSYQITFQRVDTPDSTPIVSGPRIVPPYASERSAPIEVCIDRGLVNNARYSAIVYVNTSAEMSTSSAEYFFGECMKSFSSALSYRQQYIDYPNKHQKVLSVLTFELVSKI